jgi:hypothetical protein
MDASANAEKPRAVPAITQQRRWLINGPSAALFLLAIIPVAVIIRLIDEYGVDVPYGDEWSLIPLFAKWNNHQLTFADLFRQHNDHRIFFPKLIYLAFAKFTHWNVRAEMFFSVLLCCGISACIYVLLKRTVPGTTQKHLLLWALCNLLIFAPVQAENWLWGFQLQIFIPTLGLVASLVVLGSQLRPVAKFLATFLLVLVATFSFGGGLLLWPVIGLYLLLQWEKKRWLIAWSALFILTAVFYFAGYHRQPVLGPETGNPLDYIAYFVQFNGVALTRSSLTAGAAISAGIVGTSGVVLFLTVCWLTLKSPIELRRANSSWFALGAYAVASAALAAYTRVSTGPQQALSSRYASISVNLYVALIGLVAIASQYSRASESSTKFSKFFASSSTPFFTALLTLSALSFPAALDHMTILHRIRNEGLADLEFCTVIAPPEKLRNELLIRSEPSGIMQDVDLLDHLHLLNPPIRHSTILHDGEKRPQRSTTEFGRATDLTQKNPDTFEISGWSFLPQEQRAAPCVVLAYLAGENWTAFGLSDIRETRPNIVKEMKNRKYFETGWRKIVNRNDLLEGATRISAWAVDAAAGEVYKLPGDFILPAR